MLLKVTAEDGTVEVVVVGFLVVVALGVVVGIFVVVVGFLVVVGFFVVVVVGLVVVVFFVVVVVVVVVVDVVDCISASLGAVLSCTMLETGLVLAASSSARIATE